MKFSRKRISHWLRTSLGALAIVSTASAATVTYTETITTSGNLDGNAFTNALVTLTLTGDTANLKNTGLGGYQLPGTLQITVAGLAITDSLLNAFVNVYQQNSPVAEAGFFDQSAVVLYTINNAFSSYDLTTSIGPVKGTSLGYTGGSYVTASGGSLYLGGPFNVDHPSTFSATVATGTPEPATAFLLGGGIAGALIFRRFRRA